MIDPIDGTRQFITGRPTFGTVIGLCRAGQPVLGIVDQPIIAERWFGARGQPSTFNGKPIRTRACPHAADAMLYAISFELYHGADAEAYRRLRAAVRDIQFSGDCYAHALLAMGFVDVVLECGLKPWDWVGLVPIVEGAGGKLVDWRGRAPDLAGDGRLVTLGDPALVPEVTRLLAG